MTTPSRGQAALPHPRRHASADITVLAGLAVLTIMVCLRWTSGLDRTLLDSTVSRQDTVMSIAARLVVWGGQFWLVGLVCGVGALLLARRERTWRPALAVATVLVSVNVSVFVLKWALGRTAPATGHDLVFAGGASYPSGHAATGAAGLWLLAALVSAWLGRRVTRSAAAGVAVAAALVGAATVVLGYHWPTDVLAGWLLGAFGARLGHRLWYLHEVGTRHTPADPAGAAGVNDPAGVAAPRPHTIGHRS